MSGEPHIPSMSSSTDHTVAEAYHLTPTYHDVVIAGAGVSAIAMAIQLERKLSITNTLLIEKETDLGGTWYLNSYPGCACDVPAPFYSFSFEPKADWSCLHPPQAELHQYFADVAKKWKVPQRTRLQTRVVEARFDEVTGLWHTIAQDVSKDPAKHPPEFSHYVSKLFVLAVGGLSHPTEFKAKGYDQFQGATFHSQRWDHSVDFEGKDVVVVGNGCTATQIVPHLQKKVKRLTQFASSKHWIAPEPKNPLSGVPGAHWILRNIPIIAWLYRAMIFLFSESMFGMMRLGRFGEWYRNRWHQLCVNYIKQHAPAKYWDALIPTEEELPVGCRRRIFDNGSYLHSLKAPNVELIGERLDQFGTDWVQTQDGRRIHADIVVLCTGYIAAICAKTPIRIYGRKGEELHDHWDRYGVGAHFAYRSTLQAGFPNMSVLVGSNSTTGHSSVIFTSESQVLYMLETFKPILASVQPSSRAINHVPPATEGSKTTNDELTPEDRQGATVDVSLEAELGDLRWTCKEMTQTIFHKKCSSWYKDAGANRVVALHPQSQVAFLSRAIFPNWADLTYHLPGTSTPTTQTPSTVPWWKWLGNRILGLGTLPEVDPNDPAIAYARPYGSDAAAKDEKVTFVEEVSD